VNCPGCSRKQAAADRFCRHCGFPLKDYSESLMKAKALFNRGEYAQAMELLRRAAADHPEEAEIQAWLGHAHFFSGSPELAEEEY
jgi:Flp pilus assembly protein TadD